MRGKAYSYLQFFHPQSSQKIGFGAGARFFNSRAICFADHVSFGVGARIECHYNASTGNTGTISFGAKTSFGDYFHGGSINEIRVGENVLGGSGILIVDHSHGSPKSDLANRNPVAPRDRPLSSHGAIIIGNNVWIGDNVVILAGTEIEEGVIIAAGATVRGRIAAYTVIRNANAA
jgi:acetyltransferase-like isoleucine patch superfamily enzyme